MEWRFRTRFDDDIVVTRDWDSRGKDPALRAPNVTIRFELRDWLLGWDDFDRRQLLEMYSELRGSDFRSTMPGDLLRYVLPELEEAFARGALVAYKLPRPKVPVGLFPPQKDAASVSQEQPTEWVEVMVTDDAGEPYTGPYRLDLSDGRVISGQLNLGGTIHVDGIPGGSCKVTFR